MTLWSVIGAGVAGLTVATEMVARGARVQVFDPGGPPGPHGCSWWAGGMLAPWCEYENAEEPVLRLGQQAIGWWEQHTTVTRRGTLVVANPRDLPDLRRFGRRTEGFREINQTEILGLESDLGAFSKGLHFPDEAHLDPRRALSDLYRGLLDKDVDFHRKPAPAGLENAIDCRGLHAREVLHDLRGVKGEMLVIRAPDVALTRPVRLLHPRMPLYVVPRADHVYMLGATMIESEDSGRITARSMLELLSAAYALNPAFGEAEVLEIGVDLRPAFPDNLPRIRRLGRTIYANGLYRHGYLLAPALAQGVADLALNNTHTELVDEDRA
ncbi:FAD-dependent oxidoreductase [Ruegeria pomeroyi]|uniref:D-amino-acid oxidase n=2 Tax=Ruegeria pomeroyi TaxID=89184 RepID=Q5LWJ3_RUEPO|nr:FAD-dependent oxidoreductase [Ruegeria pomeroyi]HCE70667.1 FAD-dependent oxidoreductase [Ruegeria sp.]AAV93377.1 thiamine biosynthesis oxidoreductase ThiO, putative [Ruegeria pomeroyi DSS-3]NVK99657.1 FAD-dependent oxidoreductase [Ruegeria pomeroyi]NVL02625.1 FAD-dependent oxidoreductase [Ruegeria pomeroyi]QWV10673.1 FAD-dependent oxidoreductase [Ruegeria pomeroyi]